MDDVERARPGAFGRLGVGAPLLLDQVGSIFRMELGRPAGGLLFAHMLEA